MQRKAETSNTIYKKLHILYIEKKDKYTEFENDNNAEISTLVKTFTLYSQTKLLDHPPSKTYKLSHL